MNTPLDDLYLEWLYGHVAMVDKTDPAKTYWHLLRILYQKEFVWTVPNDDNRVEDGRDLRVQFLHTLPTNQDNYPEEWVNLPCSMLEMLIGLSIRLAFQADGRALIWFWHLCRNININQYDDLTPIPEKEVDAILDTVIWRTYSADGHGGLFPLNDAKRDQRKIEIWYQLSAYLLERD